MPEHQAVTLTERQQDDLELLLAGALRPLDGFGPAESGVTLEVPLPGAAAGESVRLLDEEGAPLADLTVTATYPAADGIGLVGPVRRAGARSPRPFERCYQARAEPSPAGPAPLVVPTDRVLTQADIDHIRRDGRRAVLLALVGSGTPLGLSASELIRCCLAAARHLPDAVAVAVPLARRDGLADTALRQRVVHHHASAAAAPSDRPADVWWPTHHLPPEGAPARTATGPATPGCPSPEPVSGATRRGAVVLLTGLSGSGKSTIARGVRNALIEQGRRAVTLLDGDVVRRTLSAGLGFSPADRDTNVRRIGWVAAEIARHGGIVIACPIAPYADARAAVREMVRAAGGEFVLVHVATPLAECERRDRKGLYARARRGDIADFTGISAPYQDPHDADLRIDTLTCTPEQAVTRVLAELDGRGLLGPR